MTITKITEKILDEMRRLRKQNLTYRQIQTQLGVSKAQCIKYLSSIKIENTAISNEWKLAEQEAEIILKKNGFLHIVNLNEINPSCYWDYLAIKDNNVWLIDVTISLQKSESEKQERLPEKYRGAILLKTSDGLWKMWELQFKEINLV